MSKLKSNKQLINTRYHKNIYRKILLIIAKIQQKSVLIDMCGMCSIIIPRVSSVVLYDKSKKLYHQRVVVIFLLCFFFSFRPALILIKRNLMNAGSFSSEMEKKKFEGPLIAYTIHTHAQHIPLLLFWLLRNFCLFIKTKWGACVPRVCA